METKSEEEHSKLVSFPCVLSSHRKSVQKKKKLLDMEQHIHYSMASASSMFVCVCDSSDTVVYASGADFKS